MTEPKKTAAKKPHGGARANAGRKPHAPTEQQRKQVEALSGYGIPMEQIAALVGVDEKTVRAHYDDDLNRGRAVANSTVAKTLFEKATKEKDTTALIWWTKSRMGWTEKQQLEVSGVLNIHVHS
jgi:DNA-binding CsgD family transcriptional regulator